jgi:thiol-disulfide isomerase/thioredoxin
MKQEMKQVDTNSNKIIVFLADWCPHCTNFKPELNEIMKTNNNIELVDSNNITEELKKYIEGFPTAIRVSDKTVAVGAPNILNMIKTTVPNRNVNIEQEKQYQNVNMKQGVKSQNNYTFVYSNNCKYSQMIIPKWLDFKVYASDNKLNINISEFESEEINNLSDNYKNKLVGFPTLFINNDKYEGYDDIINHLKNSML